MADRKYYVLCANNCKFESMTKEQILTAIEQAVNDGTIANVDSGFVTTLKEQNKKVGLKMWVGTTAEFNALAEKEPNCFYIKTDDTTKDELFLAIEEIQKTVDDLTKDIAQLIYPVGSIYMSVNNINPSILFGGEWASWGAGRVPVGVGTTVDGEGVETPEDLNLTEVEFEGGWYTKTLSIGNIPPHTHTYSKAAGVTGVSTDGTVEVNANTNGTTQISNNNISTHTHTITLTTANTGQTPNGASHPEFSRMQPYITCYMWKRTA